MCVEIFPNCTFVGIQEMKAETYLCLIFYDKAKPYMNVNLMDYHDTTFYRLEKGVNRVECPLAKNVFPSDQQRVNTIATYDYMGDV
ncbi:unnamed protein product [Haemonchus placei]|uniref:Sema domain-containing protein n=1 Tax=Haemonchus placei TaxID=6290 RepID=A0A0N4XBB6_HAEPC|nr:unnamed protein product [Haemonchus placei]